MKHLFSLRRALLLGLLATSALAARAQTGGVGIGTTAPDASAALDIVSSTKGALLPRLTTAQRTAIASPATGLIVFQTDGTPGYYYYVGGAWQQIATAAGAAVTAGNGLTKTGQNLTLGGTLTSPATILQSGNNFSLTGGNVGIGTALPSAALEVSGDFRVSNGTVANTLGTPATGNASNTSFPNSGQSFTLPAGGGSITSVRLRSAATYSTTFAIYQGGGNGGTLLYGPAPINFVNDVPSTVALTTPLPLAAGTYTLTLTAPQNLRYFSSDVYAGGSYYFGGGAGTTIDMEFAVSYTTGTPVSSLYVAPGGNVGIGTTSAPAARLDVTGGSIQISTAGQGLTFPDGTTQTTANRSLSISGSNLTLSGTGGNTVALPTTAGATGPQGATGPTGATGPAGPQGVAGPAGPTGATGATGPASSQGVVAVRAFTGFINPIAGSSSVYVFAGGTTTVTITSSTQKLVASGVAPLAVTSGGIKIPVGMCYQSTVAGNPVVNFVGYNYSALEISTVRSGTSVSATATNLAPGNYVVGVGVLNNSAATISNNDYVNGYVMVVD